MSPSNSHADPESDLSSDPAPFKHKLRVPRARRGDSRLYVGTRKGLFAIDVDPKRQEFSAPIPALLGYTVFHVVADPRDRETVLAGVRDAQGTPTVMVSRDGGRTFDPADEPPRFTEEGPFEDAEHASRWDRSVHHVFWLTAGHKGQPGTWFCGTAPQGLFRSDDSGRTWEPVHGLHRHPSFDEWTNLERDATPDGPKLHSILVDPRDADHMYVAMSTGGVLETTDAGGSWERLDGGLEGDAARDPHRVVMAPTNPDRLWQQSHFGVFRLDREEGVWHRVGEVGDDTEQLDAGFPIAVHPADPDVCLTVPMDGSDAWTRMPKDGRPTVNKTVDQGASWTAHAIGPDSSWWTVKRQGLCVDGFDSLGLYLGTSTGEIWFSIDEGETWVQVARGLPYVYSVEIG